MANVEGYASTLRTLTTGKKKRKRRKEKKEREKERERERKREIYRKKTTAYVT